MKSIETSNEVMEAFDELFEDARETVVEDLESPINDVESMKGSERR